MGTASQHERAGDAVNFWTKCGVPKLMATLVTGIIMTNKVISNVSG